MEKGVPVRVVIGQRGRPKIIYHGFSYCCAKIIKNRAYWVCSKEKSKKCKARLISDTYKGELMVKYNIHNHEMEYDKQGFKIIEPM